jgi:hypothetical protein
MRFNRVSSVNCLINSLTGNTPLFFFAKMVKSAGFALSLELSGPSPFPSLLWHGAQLDRYSALLASESCAHPEAFKPMITLATISHFTAAFCMANSERSLTCVKVQERHPLQEISYAFGQGSYQGASGSIDEKSAMIDVISEKDRPHQPVAHYFQRAVERS